MGNLTWYGGWALLGLAALRGCVAFDHWRVSSLELKVRNHETVMATDIRIVQGRGTFANRDIDSIRLFPSGRYSFMEPASKECFGATYISGTLLEARNFTNVPCTDEIRREVCDRFNEINKILYIKNGTDRRLTPLRCESLK